MTYIFTLAVIILMVGAIALLPAWGLMLLLGTLHHLTGWPTAIGYWACYVMVLILSFFVRGIKFE